MYHCLKPKIIRAGNLPPYQKDRSSRRSTKIGLEILSGLVYITTLVWRSQLPSTSLSEPRIMEWWNFPLNQKSQTLRCSMKKGPETIPGSIHITTSRWRCYAVYFTHPIRNYLCMELSTPSKPSNLEMFNRNGSRAFRYLISSMAWEMENHQGRYHCFKVQHETRYARTELFTPSKY